MAKAINRKKNMAVVNQKQPLNFRLPTLDRDI